MAETPNTDKRKWMAETLDRDMLDRNIKSRMVTFINLHQSAGVGGADLLSGQPLQEIGYHSPFLSRLQEEITHQVAVRTCGY